MFLTRCDTFTAPQERTLGGVWGDMTPPIFGRKWEKVGPKFIQNCEKVGPISRSRDA